MKTGFASQKVPAGKLIQVETECDDTVIHGVKLTGDFFLHPEEKVTLIEKCLEGKSVKCDAADLVQCIKEVVEREGITLVGVTPQDIVATLIQSMVTCQG